MFDADATDRDELGRPIFSFIVAGPPVEDLAVPGTRRWFVVSRLVAGGPARLSQRLTLSEARTDLHHLSQDRSAWRRGGDE
jgi:hypothetical protein